MYSTPIIIHKMIELCIENGENIVRRQKAKVTSKLGNFLLGLGFRDEIVEMLVYKDKLNHLVVWYLLFCIMTFSVIFIICY